MDNLNRCVTVPVGKYEYRVGEVKQTDRPTQFSIVAREKRKRLRKNQVQV